jgi:hypothetical protein
MRTSFHHQSEAQPPNGPLTAATSPDTPSPSPTPGFPKQTTDARNSRAFLSTRGLCGGAFRPFPKQPSLNLL